MRSKIVNGWKCGVHISDGEFIRRYNVLRVLNRKRKMWVNVNRKGRDNSWGPNRVGWELKPVGVSYTPRKKV